MERYRVTFVFEHRELTLKNSINEEEKKALEESFRKVGTTIRADNRMVLLDLSKCLYVLFEEVE